jgi:hypothetical protein
MLAARSECGIVFLDDGGTPVFLDPRIAIAGLSVETGGNLDAVCGELLILAEPDAGVQTC